VTRPPSEPLLVSGQVGARKSVLKSRLTLYPRWDDAVEFGSDALRMYHPEYERPLHTDADTAWFYPEADARAWVEDALNHCLEQRVSSTAHPRPARTHADRAHQITPQLLVGWGVGVA